MLVKGCQGWFVRCCQKMSQIWAERVKRGAKKNYTKQKGCVFFRLPCGVNVKSTKQSAFIFQLTNMRMFCFSTAIKRMFPCHDNGAWNMPAKKSVIIGAMS